ncbi:MAG: nicotinate-nucleotide diphosphorylase (carboxylating) [Pirellulaceae bacterium]|nr:MAG: nicotinate-nucleotide diphosphorylase (carboxylating) [Pirellulaceae bacterium]
MKDHWDFPQQDISETLLDDLAQLIHLAVREDLDRGLDVTTVALIPPDATAAATIVARQPGVAAGIELVASVVEVMGANVATEPLFRDGDLFEIGSELVRLSGAARDLLTCERILLNLLSRLCSVASTTRRFVERVSDLPVRIYDTRKTTPGWRRLEKYAVRCGGGRNHRAGLYDAVLIKDNHLACCMAGQQRIVSPAECVVKAREFLRRRPPESGKIPIEIEVDTLDQLRSVLPTRPDIVLLDNMSIAMMREAVQVRNEIAPEVELEASGGIHLDTVRDVASTGVDRISIGALTHSAGSIDLGLDWNWSGGKSAQQ